MQKYGKKSSCLIHLDKLGKNIILFSNRSASLCWFTNNVIRNGLWGTGGLWDISNDRCGCVWLPPPDRNHGEVCGGATCLAVSSLYNVIIFYRYIILYLMVKNIFADIWGLYSGFFIISAQQTIWLCEFIAGSLWWMRLCWTTSLWSYAWWITWRLSGVTS